MKHTKQTDIASQVKASEHALAVKSEHDPAPAYVELNEPTPGEGQVNPATEHHTPMGAFGAEGNEPVLRRSRHVR